MDSPIGLINSQQQPINDFVTELEDKFQAVGVMPLQFISCADRRDDAFPLIYAAACRPHPLASALCPATQQR